VDLLVVLERGGWGWGGRTLMISIQGCPGNLAMGLLKGASVWGNSGVKKKKREKKGS